VSESNIILGPLINLSVPVGGVNAATGQLPTEVLGAYYEVALAAAVGAYASGQPVGIYLGALSYIFDFDCPEVQVGGRLPSLFVGTPGVDGDFFGLPIILSGLSGTGTFSLQGATVETGEQDALNALEPTGGRVVVPTAIQIGATVNVPDATPASFTAVQATIGPLTVRRVFSSSLPTHMPAGIAGIVAFYSFKSNTTIQDLINGVHDAAVRTLVQSLPNGTYLTSYHEPENDMDGDTFVALMDHLYPLVKSINPTIQFGPVYMTYWWRPSLSGVGKPGNGHNPQPKDSWEPHDYDFLGCDNYAQPPQTPLELASDTTFQNWYTWAKAKANAANVPVCIVEYGAGAITSGMTGGERATMEAARAVVIANDGTYVASEPTIGMWLLWDGTGAAGDWFLHDSASQAAWAAIASGGSTTGTAFAGIGDKSIWMQFTAPLDGTFTFTVDDASTPDYRLAIYHGEAIDDPAMVLLGEVFANGSTDPTLSVEFSRGESYYVYVNKVDGTSTTYPLQSYTWSFGPAVLGPVLTIDPNILDRVPTGLVVSLVNMLDGGEAVDFTLVGNASVLATLQADEQGTIVGVTVPLGLPLSAGTYTLQATGESSGRVGSCTFQLLNDPMTRPAPPPDDVPVSPPTQVGIQRWVFQDPMPGGLATLVFPANPEKASSFYAPVPVTVEHTVAQDGTAVVWEGAPTALAAQFSGYTTDETFYLAVEAYAALNRKFYLIDHRSKVWVVALTSFGPDRRIVQPVHQTDSSWACNYTATVMIFAGPM
jgi:hypothetical protein